MARKTKSAEDRTIQIGFVRKDAAVLLEMLRTGIVPRAALPEGYRQAEDGTVYAVEPTGKAAQIVAEWQAYALRVQNLQTVTDTYRAENLAVLRMTTRVWRALNPDADESPASVVDTHPEGIEPPADEASAASA